MNKFFLLIFMASTIVALTIGCEDKRKSDDDDSDIETDNMLPSEIIYSNDDGLYDVTKFWYNDKSRIIKAEWYHRDTLYSVQDYAYDKSGKLTSITYNGGNGLILSFVYSGNFVTVYFGGTHHSSLHELQNGLLINDYENGTLATTYSYDSKNNAIKVSDKLFERETSITYEDKSGIYSGINMPQWFLMFDYATFRYPFHVVNNPLQIEKTQDGSSSTYTYNYETYNEKNYPTQFTVTETKSNSADSSTAYYGIKYIDAK